MKTHTNSFKENIVKFGREIGSKITYELDNETIELSGEELNSVAPHYEGAILKSVMKQLDIDSNVEIPIGTILTYEFGLKVGNGYEYINFGNYIVKSTEKQEDTRSWKITCYDKMLYAMKDYENSGITFPITIRNYISAICNKIGLTFANSNDTFANYDKEIPNELYLDENGNSLGYTFRDVLDELAEATASTICINASDKLEVRYINKTEDKNLYDIDNTRTVTNGVVVDENGWITITWDNTSGTATKYLNYYTYNLNLQPSTNYNIVVEIKNVSGNGYAYFVSTTSTHQSQFTQAMVYQFSALSSNTIKQSIRQTYDNFSSSLYGLRTFVSFNAGQSGSITFRLSVLEDTTITANTFSYEPYGDTIDEEYLKDINVNFGEKFGTVNTIILSRSADSDKIAQSIPSDLADEDKIAIQITDNQIMNDNNRADFIPAILNQLYGLEYYINDFSSTGICYLDLCDKYNVKIGDNFYSCIMFNDEINITQGLEEIINTEMPEKTEQDYKYTSNDDRKVNQVYIIAKKNQGEIEAVVSAVRNIEVKEGNDYQNILNKFQPIDDALIDIDEYKTITRQLQTDTYTKTEIQQIANGTGVGGVKVSAVITTSGTFDEDGMTYEKTNAPTKTTINQIGINTKDKNDNSLLFAGYVDENTAPQDLLNKYGDYANQTIVGTDNIIVNNYLNIGTHSRIQDYGNGTGIFWR